MYSCVRFAVSGRFSFPALKVLQLLSLETMRAIILAVGERERKETQGERKEEDEKKNNNDEKKKKKGGNGESFSSTSDVDLLLVFKPLLQYAIESVQKCSSLVTSCVVLVEREDAQFAKELCEKMTTTYASSSSLPSSSSNKSTTLTTTKEKKVRFEVLEVEGKGGDANALREVLTTEMNESDDENVLVVSHKTVFDVPLEEIVTAHRRLDASLTVLMSERRAWDEIDAKYGRAPKNAKYVGLSDDVEERSTSRNRKSKKLMIKRLVFSSSESEKTVKINRSALDSVGNVRASVRYRDVRVYCFSTAALVKCLKKVSLARSNDGVKSFMSLKNDIVPEMCKAQFWNTAATNNGDDGKENDVVENGGTLSSEKPVLAIICRPEQQRDNFACEIERVTPHFLEISKEILSAAQSLVGREPSARHENFVASDVELGGKVIIGAHCAILPGVSIGEKTHIKRSVISRDARVGANSKITNSVIGSNARVEANCQIVNCVIGDRACVGKNSTLKECVVECDCEVEEDENVREETLRKKERSAIE
jgi:NDP-sugar pyrophosphorylase family protein